MLCVLQEYKNAICIDSVLALDATKDYDYYNYCATSLINWLLAIMTA